MRLFWPLLRILQRERPDVVVMSLPQANVLSRLAVSIRRTPVVVAFEHSSRAGLLYRFLGWSTSPAVDVVLYDTPATWEAVQGLYGWAKQIRSMEMPLFAHNDAIMDSVVLNRDRTTVLMVGRLVPPKNHQSAIRTIRLVRDRGHDVKMRIIGEGPLREGLKSLRHALALDEVVRFEGYRPGARELIASCGFFLSTSYREGLSLAVLEAFAARTPVVATRVGGPAKYGKDKHSIIFSRSSTPFHIAEALIWALSNPKETELIAENAYAFVSRTFTHANLERQLKAFSQIVAERMSIGSRAKEHE